MNQRLQFRDTAREVPRVHRCAVPVVLNVLPDPLVRSESENLVHSALAVRDYLQETVAFSPKERG
ncbi:MAG: hypothetical protein ACE14M_10155 [Terriglobales bacterium]